MPHYAFIKRVRVGSKDDFYAHCVLASTKIQAKSLVLTGSMGYIPSELIEFGECPEGWENSSDLYDKCCKKAEKLRLKSQGCATLPMEQLPMGGVNENESKVAV